jgi:type II secretory ATPase GspE/PulE/Tfp pilus assembly ATPase PilB-like protein
MSTDATLFKNLQKVTSKIHATDNIDEIILDVSKDICTVFEADRLTIYAVNEDRNAIVSKVKTGLNTTKDLILPIAAELSVAGYVALNKKLVNIADAYDEKELRAFNPPVIFLREIDKRFNYRTRQMLVAPILEPRSNDLLGVVQIINRLSKSPFTNVFEEAATELCRTLAVAFRQRTVRKPAVRSKFEFLVVEGLLSPTQFDLVSASARQKEIDLEEYLRSECQMKDKELGEALSRYYRVPYEPFKADRAKPEELLKRLKRDYWDKSSWLPLEEAGDTMIVLAADPQASSPREVANMLGKHKVEFRVCTRREFQSTKELYFTAKSGLDIVPDEPLPEEEKPPAFDEPKESDNEVRRVVNKIIVDAKNMDASDIHIEPRPGTGNTRIRMRKDGSLLNYAEIPARLRNPVTNLLKIMSNLDIAEKRVPQNGKIKFKQFGPLDIELRVATIPTAGGVEDVVLRILASGKPIKIEELRLSKRNLEALKQAVANPYGLFFVCGPTGSGKTTTLHSVLGYLNTEDTKIWTAEDPVEITQEGLRQVQINIKAKLTFAESMRAFLRADPDIIMVGEMRDEETAHTGIEASLTGHLVMATLHTNSAPESITRLLDMKMDPLNFADALLGILAQRLARKLCQDCKTGRAATPDEIKALLEEYSVELKNTESWKQHPNAEYKKLYDEWVKNFGDKGQITLYAPGKCEKCANTGYRGRVGLHELLIGTDAIKKEIVGKAPVSRLFAVGLEEGMRTLKQDGIEKVLLGLTDMDEVRSVCIK